MQDATQLECAEREIRALNEQLEERVRRRTAELEAAKRALEHEVLEHQQAVESLQRGRRQLRDIIDNSGAVIYLKDLDGRYLLVNQHFDALFAPPGRSCIGMTDPELFPPDVVAAFRANDVQVAESRRTLHFEEVALQRGELHTYVTAKFPLYDAAGHPYGVCGISTDISERKRMEAELRRSEATLLAVIESTDDAVFAVGLDFKLRRFNRTGAERYRALCGQELTGDSDFDTTLPADLLERWRDYAQRVFAGEQLVIEESQPADGEMRHYLITLSPTVEDGQITGATVFTKDITDLKRAEERVREHQAELAHVLRVRTMNEMAANLAHEINQPLAAIANYAQGCRNRILAGASSTDLLEAVEQISSEALRAGGIIRRLRELVQKQQTPREQIDLNEVVQRAAQVVAPLARQRRVDLQTVLRDLPPVTIDAIQIEQVVVNLLVNGIEAIERAGSDRREVKVCTTAGPDAIVVAVTDSGIGLAPELGDEIFEPFRSSKPDGLGMGLAISRSIIEAHGGHLVVFPLPQGCSFRFALPINGATRNEPQP